jgi:ankyrin repeat protein
MDLHNALYYGEISVAEQIIRSGIDPDIRDNYGDTALRRALYDWHFGIANLLIEFGANINSINDNGISLLNEAIMDNNILAVDFLIRHGVNVNVRSNNILPLDLALIHNYTNIILTLKQNGGNSDSYLQTLR